jgi:hypothetical protein
MEPRKYKLTAPRKRPLWKIEAQARRTKHMIQAQKHRTKAARQTYQRKWNGLPQLTRPCPARCECCGNLPGTRALALDHCHKTGAFRGWLCARCNTGLGMFKDSPRLLQCGADYLTRNLDPILV